MRMRTCCAALLSVLLVACSSPSGDEEPSGAETLAESTEDAVEGTAVPVDDAESDSAAAPDLAPPFDVVLEEGARRTESIGPDGGTLEVAGSDSTTYTLHFPPDALLETVEITATPVLSFGAGNESAHGVVFEPSGLHFLADVTLTMTAPEDIPVERQLVFEFSDDGGEVVAAEPVLDDEQLVVHVGHFSGYGFADLRNTVREKWTGWRTERTEAQIQNEMRDLLSKERMDQLLGMGGDPALNDKFAEATKRYEKEVVRVRLANADTSCAAAKEAVQTALGYLRQTELMGIPQGNPDLPLTYAQVIGVMLDPCEKEAKAQCKAARDPGILLSFWIQANRYLPGRYDIDTTKAEMICDPQMYHVVGGLQDLKVDQRVCSIVEPFTLTSPGVGTMRLSGGLKGTYTFEGKFNSIYTGTYRISFPDGARRPGTMTSRGSGSVAGQGGSGTETFALTPLGPEC